VGLHADPAAYGSRVGPETASAARRTIGSDKVCHPMFLNHITLENVRSIERLHLSLEQDSAPRKWTFLLGENGTGKTTLLRAVALILAGSDALPDLLGDPRDWVRAGTREARISAGLVTAAGEARTVEMVIGAEDSIREVYARNGALLEQLDSALRHSTRNYFTVGYGVSRRPSEGEKSSPQPQEFFRSVRAQSVATLFSSNASLTSLETWAMDLDYRRPDGFAVVRDAIGALLPGIAFAGIDRERRQLLFTTPDGKIPYRLLSEGYQNVAAWTGDLLYQITNVFDDYPDPFRARGLLLVDEIDLHLHPVWQRELVSFIQARFPQFQVVATTHSPLTVHQAGEGELFFLRRPGPREPAVLHAYEGAPRDLMLHQLLTSPVFGLTTLDSREVEAMKAEYRHLRSAGGLDPAEQQRLRQLEDELSDLPDWSEGIEGQAELKGLLEDIGHQLRRN
jgi:energy-coupling factor transporter ATP-binding protein EcfA2